MAAVPDSLTAPLTAASTGTAGDTPDGGALAGQKSPWPQPVPPSAPTILSDPPQGHWTIEQWAGLGEDAPRAEYVDGCVEMLTVPKISHLLIQAKLTELLRARLGWSRVFDNGLKLRIGRDRGRIPDVVVLRTDLAASDDESLDAAAVLLVVEVISPGRRQRDRDLREKREDYAAAGIDEYWIVDPDAKTLTQLRLPGGAGASGETGAGSEAGADGEADAGRYEEVGTFGGGDSVTTPLVDGLRVAVGELFG